MVFRLHTSEGRKIFHREQYTIRALAQLKRAQTGKISKLMNEFAKADIEIEYKRMYPSYDFPREHHQAKKNKEMLQDIKWASITQRALPDILKNLIGEGLVTKSESDVYIVD